ncbi:interleukin-2 receptor subunit beta [Lemur catta]|uniref:interleukin-2 receptor subunit beta n=1 Tax=Lemur catta TaxID=9447 RepID=UPI001E26BE39|nr:interleukin-2 receptor subunit beta [Lemur catta]
MAAPALSWCLSLLVLLPLAACRASAAVNDTSQLTCFYNSKANISCVWSRDGGLQGTSCHIHAQSNKRSWNKTCELVPVRRTSWACNLILGAPDSQTLTAADTVNMSVMCREGKRWSMVMSQAFKPFENLRLMAPVSLQVIHIGTHRCNVTWAVSHSSHYIESYLEFEARTRSPGQRWEEAPLLTLKQKQQWICLETLTPDTHYELQVRVKPQQGDHTVWSPWSQPLAFRTQPEAPRKETPPLPWFGHVLVGLGGACGFVILVSLLVNCRYIRLWLKKVLKCHIPDPSEFFSQLSSEHGGDFQKWLSSPFPSSSFSPGGPAPEISPLEVLERDAKAAQLLLLQQDKVASPSPSTSGHSLTSCFTNQGYFFFHLPDALEIEACQVYFTYDPCTEEEPDEGVGGPGVPVRPPFPPLQPLSGEDDAYCTLPPGEDLLLFSPSLLGGPSPPDTVLGGSGAGEERLPPSLQEGVPGHWAPQPPRPPTPRAPDLVDFQCSPELALGEAGEEVPVPGPGEGAGFPWACSPGQGQDRAPTSHLTPISDVYLSLQELQDQDPAHLV